MKIPSSIKIGNKEYAIKEVKIVNFFNTLNPLRLFKDGGTIIGQICKDNKDIRLQKDLKPKKKKMVFFHELAHGIMWEMEKSHPQVSAWRDDEVFTDKFGRMLSRTFDNLMKSQNQ